MHYRDLEAAWAYHEGTKHSPYSIRASRHFLDWENQPLPYKIYLDLEPIPLLRELGPSAIPALSVLRGEVVERPEECVPELPIISRLLYYSGGVTKRVSYPQGDKLFRAASCTGALYHVDLYLVCGDLPQLEAGVYHFGVHDFALRRLRRGDFRGELLAATAGETAVAHAPAVLVCTSTFWRNAWK